MAQKLIPGGPSFDESSSGVQRAIPGFGVVDDPATSVSRRALIMSSGSLYEITNAQLGTGLKPVVIYGGEVRQRVAAEGTPLVIVSGQVRGIDASETLLI